MPKSLQQLMEEEAKRFDEELPKLITDLVWEVTDGGQKIEPNRFLSYQEEPVRSFEDIKSFILSSLQSAHELGKAEAMEESNKKTKAVIELLSMYLPNKAIEEVIFVLSLSSPSSDITTNQKSDE